MKNFKLLVVLSLVCFICFMACGDSGKVSELEKKATDAESKVAELEKKGYFESVGGAETAPAVDFGE